MRLEEGVNLYVRRKQAGGLVFERARRTYRAFLSEIGNLPLNQIYTHHVSEFLARRKSSPSGFRRTHSLLRHFFEYWSAHRQIAPILMPPNQPARRSRFLPYIYTKEELRRLLQMPPLCRSANDKIHEKTLRTALLMLYGTGATVGEVVRIGHDDLDLRKATIRFPGSLLKAGRCIPIGRDLGRVLRQHATWQMNAGNRSQFFLSRIDGKQITSRALRAYFERYRRVSGFVGGHRNSQIPTLRDLRTTFAVHRITSWIKTKKDLGLMLPALSAYMGNAGLESTERYVQLAPERFQEALNKLSPPESQLHWRHDPVLQKFLASL